MYTIPSLIVFLVNSKGDIVNLIKISRQLSRLAPRHQKYLKFEALKPLLDLYESKLPSEESIKLELTHAERVIK